MRLEARLPQDSERKATISLPGQDLALPPSAQFHLCCWPSSLQGNGRISHPFKVIPVA